MAKNNPIGDNARKGAVKDRKQVYNPVIDRWIKMGDDGKFMSQKDDGTPYKGVHKLNKEADFE
ncbi:MAG: hypothetical protein PHI37_03800 [Candidatus Gracilibacteria bacterium]|nr:hypothetical protein [Candidatus Gracilibacteria bacterium]